MTWGNYGLSWHIDHIRPVTGFNLSTLEGIRECFALSNLRPLEKMLNHQKGNRRHELL